MPVAYLCLLTKLFTMQWSVEVHLDLWPCVTFQYHVRRSRTTVIADTIKSGFKMDLTFAFLVPKNLIKGGIWTDYCISKALWGFDYCACIEIHIPLVHYFRSDLAYRKTNVRGILPEKCILKAVLGFFTVHVQKNRQYYSWFQNGPQIRIFVIPK